LHICGKDFPAVTQPHKQLCTLCNFLHPAGMNNSRYWNAVLESPKLLTLSIDKERLYSVGNWLSYEVLS